MLINVLDCASPEAAIAMAIDGDRVYFPGIQKYVAPIGGYQLTKNIEVFGDGPGRADGYNGTLILPNSAADAGGLRNVFCIAPGANVDLSAVCIHDLRINVNQTPALGSAIYCKLVAGSNHRVRAVRIERVTAFNVLGNIVHLEGANLGTEYIESVVMTECATTLGGNFGVFLLNVWLARLMMSTLIANAGGAGYFESSGVAMYAGDMDGNCLSTAAKQGPLRFVNCKQVLVDATHVENFYKLPNGSRPIEVGLNVESSGGAVLISACTFDQASDTTFTCTGILASGSQAGPVVVLSNHFIRVFDKLVNLYAGSCGVLAPQLSDEGELGSHTPAVIAPFARAIVYPGIVSLSFPPHNFNAPPLATPTYLNVPSGTAMPGMLYYATETALLMVRIGATWRQVKTT